MGILNFNIKQLIKKLTTSFNLIIFTYVTRKSNINCS